ncbi:UDP-N-acetylmuramoylalanyl-D-glutamate--2,6-diaminopimelate ligase [hydrothermal vent metagenome]|uniref:UDP-N-acetylmuramoylalanyl-D-glutamate--2,6-diaminopimelate ligase n=1 Tax=hydrothermal vent metagenome TaxID=652676 RepID=A0A3B1C4Z2_9ZZZZ
MKLDQLINSVQVVSVIGAPEFMEVNNITNNSAEVNNKSVFVAIRGFKTDGRKFIPDAISRGVKAVVMEDDSETPDALFLQNDVVKIVVDNSRRAFAELSCNLYGNPSRELKLIGITGSNGKTTTAFYIKNILETAGYKTGLLGTISNYIGDTKIESTLTTPESNKINQYMREMADANYTHCVMEVSSHALSLDRVHGLDFDYAVFTNITSDHLDFHSDFDHYLEAKKILFDSMKPSGKIIFNKDDEHWHQLLKDNQCELFSYGTVDDALFLISNVQFDLNGTSFDLSYLQNSYKVSTKLIGKFNSYNATAAAAVGLLEGVTPEKVLEGIETTPQVPGRFEVVSKGSKKVIVDYSHTADSLQKALESVHHIVKGERPIYTVFGCGGDRDKFKRPIMGTIASELSDKVYVTSDNPRSEDPLKIIEDIMEGIGDSGVVVDPDREEAIKNAICDSEDNAVILIAGKGHEDYQIINGVKSHFSDKEIAIKYLEEC